MTRRILQALAAILALFVLGAWGQGASASSSKPSGVVGTALLEYDRVIAHTQCWQGFDLICTNTTSMVLVPTYTIAIRNRSGHLIAVSGWLVGFWRNGRETGFTHTELDSILYLPTGETHYDAINLTSLQPLEVDTDATGPAGPLVSDIRNNWAGTLYSGEAVRVEQIDYSAVGT